MPEVPPKGGASPDGSTIVTDNGLLSVPIDDSTIVVDGSTVKSQNLQYIYGDFEDDTFGDWSKSGNGPFINQDNGGAESTSYYVRHYTTGIGDTSVISRSIDLTGISTLIFFYKRDPREVGNSGGSGDVYEFRVDGKTELSIGSGSDSSWVKAEIDVSALSGSTTVEIYQENSSGNKWSVGTDRIKSNPGLEIVEEENGAGGT